MATSQGINSCGILCLGVFWCCLNTQSIWLITLSTIWTLVSIKKGYTSCVKSPFHNTHPTHFFHNKWLDRMLQDNISVQQHGQVHKNAPNLIKPEHHWCYTQTFRVHHSPVTMTKVSIFCSNLSSPNLPLLQESCLARNLLPSSMPHLRWFPSLSQLWSSCRWCPSPNTAHRYTSCFQKT